MIMLVEWEGQGSSSWKFAIQLKSNACEILIILFFLSCGKFGVHIIHIAYIKLDQTYD